jgi:DNA repair exonuclease SbcCD ATPase subunit
MEPHDSPVGAGTPLTPQTARERELVAELEEQEQKLQMAAEMGQSLVERTEQLQEQIDALSQREARCSVALEEQEYRVRELTAENSQLHEIIVAREAALAAAAAADSEVHGSSQLQELSVQATSSAVQAGRSVDIAGGGWGGSRKVDIEELGRLRAELGALLEAKAAESEARADAQRALQETELRLRQIETKSVCAPEHLVYTQPSRC